MLRNSVVNSYTWVSKLIAVAGGFIILGTSTPDPAFASDNIDEEQAYLNSLTLEELMNVPVIVVTGTPQTLDQAPAIVSVITDRDIAYWGYRSVAEILNTLPGMYCIDDGLSPNCGVRGINGGFRGYSKVIKVMINGQTTAFRSDTNNYLGPELLPLSVVERIEVIRGPASARYGANAYLGAVNIITKRVKDESIGELSITQSAEGQHVSANYQHDAKQGGFTVAMSTAELDRSNTALPEQLPGRSLFSAGTSTENDISRPFNWFGQAYYKLEEHDISIDSHFSRLDTKANFVDFGRFSEIGELGTDVRYALESWYLKFTDNWRLRENLSLQLSAAHSEGQPAGTEKLDIGLVNSYPEREVGYQANDLIAEAQWALNQKHSLTLGIDYSQDKEKLFEAFEVDRKTGLRIQRAAPQGDKTFYNTGLYAQYTGNLNEQLGVTFNTRHDDQNIYGANTSYRAGAVYSINNSLSAKLLYGTSFKAPAAVQLYAQPLFDGEVAGNPALGQESAKTIESEINWLIKPNINWSLNAYHMTVDDQVELVLRGSNQIGVNQAAQDSVGLESELRWFGINNNLIANMAWQESKSRSLDMLGRTITSASELYPELFANVFWKHTISYSTYFGLHWRYASPRRASKSNIQLNSGTPYQVSEYQLLNLALQHSHDRLNFIVNIKNLLDKQYVEPGFSGVDIPGQGRNIQFTLNLNI
jgi:iron complex outermembrane receptor protein